MDISHLVPARPSSHGRPPDAQQLAQDHPKPHRLDVLPGPLLVRSGRRVPAHEPQAGNDAEHHAAPQHFAGAKLGQAQQHGLAHGIGPVVRRLPDECCRGRDTAGRVAVDSAVDDPGARTGPRGHRDGERVAEPRDAPLEVACAQQHNAGAEAVDEERAVEAVEEPAHWMKGYRGAVQQYGEAHGRGLAQRLVEFAGRAVVGGVWARLGRRRRGRRRRVEVFLRLRKLGAVECGVDKVYARHL